MVSTRSGSPSRHPPPPPTPTAGTIPLSGGGGAASPSASTSAPSQPSLSLNNLLGIIGTTECSIPQARQQLLTTLATVAGAKDGEVVLSSFLPDQQGKFTIDPLLSLDPSLHCLGYLYILTARLSHPFQGCHNGYLHQLIRYCQLFCSRCDPAQMAFAPPARVNTLSHRFLALAKYLSRPSDATPYLLDLLKVWSRDNLTNLTAVHQDFVEACVVTKNYAWASEVTSVQLVSIYKEFYALTYLDFLRYNYLAGIASSATKDWEAAEGFFESVVSAPATAASWIQIAAYKKLVLVQLIKDGKTTALPKYVSASVTRAIKQHAQTYKIFADSFEAGYGKGGKLVGSADKEIFVKDKNHGLVLQLVDTALSRQILKLTKTYEKLLVPEMAKLLGLEGAETEKVQRELTDEIFRMVSTSTLSASLSYLPSPTHPVPIVTFLPPSERYVGPETIHRLELLNQQASDLNDRVWHEDRRVGKSVKYLQKAAKEESSWGGGAGGAMGGGGGGVMDEDLMESFGVGSGTGGGGSRKTYDDNF
ncbi:hypothetical protein BDY24DRAFT_402605 [Mrakia frigida]|uniref:uncharacterized protein n=1 Tax=Mrakia frigida TaxID=29902 RepID=UPI003FCC00F3